MRKFRIKEGCIACGLCSSLCDLFKCDPVGKAYLESNHIISSSVNVSEIIDICPVGVIDVVDASKTKRKGKEGLLELKKLLKQELEAIKLKEVKRSDIPFNVDEYTFTFGSCRSSSSYEYSSYDSAHYAGMKEFYKVWNAYDGLYIGVLSQYKNMYLRPYYMLDETGFYYQNNLKYEAVLQDYMHEIKAIIADNYLSDDFFKFDVYPGDRLFLGKMEKKRSERKMEVSPLEEFEQISHGGELCLQPYGKDCYNVDVDDCERYVGDTIFGRAKYKTKYKFTGVNETVDEFKRDVIGHFKMWGSEIVDWGIDYLGTVIKAYNRAIKDEIEYKMTQLDEIIKKL